jgi:hypothetical protein
LGVSTHHQRNIRITYRLPLPFLGKRPVILTKTFEVSKNLEGLGITTFEVSQNLEGFFSTFLEKFKTFEV